jgi:hypothetical protein
MTARMRTLSRPELQNGEREVSGLWVGHPFEIGQLSSPWRAATLSDTLRVEKCTYLRPSVPNAGVRKVRRAAPRLLIVKRRDRARVSGRLTSPAGEHRGTTNGPADGERQRIVATDAKDECQKEP